MDLAIERGWLVLHESGTFVRFTQGGADGVALSHGHHAIMTRCCAGFDHASYMTAIILKVPNWDHVSNLALSAAYRSVWMTIHVMTVIAKSAVPNQSQC